MACNDLPHMAMGFENRHQLWSIFKYDPVDVGMKWVGMMMQNDGHRYLGHLRQSVGQPIELFLLKPPAMLTRNSRIQQDDPLVLVVNHLVDKASLAKVFRAENVDERVTVVMVANGHMDRKLQ